MKRIALAAVALSLLCSFAPGRADAGVTDGLGAWEGAGTTRDAAGGPSADFSVAVVRRALGPSRARTDAKITLRDGRILDFWQEIQDVGAGAFRVTSANGSGSGQCFHNQMCQSYEERADGHAFATTIALDSPDKIRILVTELEKGRAVRFIEQTLTKKP